MTNTHWKEVEARFDKEFGDCKLGTTPERCEAHDREIKSFLKEEIERAYQEGREDAVEYVRRHYNDRPTKSIYRLLREARQAIEKPN